MSVRSRLINLMTGVTKFFVPASLPWNIKSMFKKRNWVWWYININKSTWYIDIFSVSKHHCCQVCRSVSWSKTRWYQAWIEPCQPDSRIVNKTWFKIQRNFPELYTACPRSRNICAISSIKLWRNTNTYKYNSYFYCTPYSLTDGADWNKNVLRERLKLSVEQVDVFSLVGNRFQALGAATEKALSPSHELS